MAIFRRPSNSPGPPTQPDPPVASLDSQPDVPPNAFPDGHFYSPIVDLDDLSAREQTLWPRNPEALGVDWNHENHRDLLTDVFPRYFGDYDYPEKAEESTQLHRLHGMFQWLDPLALFVFLRHWRPARLIEVGSGFSSLLTADVNQRFLGGALDLTCIEPYPRPFLMEGVPGLTRLIERKVEDTPLDEFARLQSGDILFIDSSHVSKTGSDVNHLFFEVLPRLASGVYVHVHDIFLPFDYPRQWVLKQKRSWNEQYLLRAFLMYNAQFEVIFGCSYAAYMFPELIKTMLTTEIVGGGSFWMRKR